MSVVMVKDEALRLPAEERAALAELLWESLEGDDASARQRLWAQEAEDRIDAVDRGELPTVEGPAALGQILQSLR